MTLSAVLMLDRQIKAIDPTRYLVFEPATADTPPSYTVWQEGQAVAIARHFDCAQLGAFYAPDAYVPDETVVPHVPVRVDQLTAAQQARWTRIGQQQLAERAANHQVRTLLDLGAVRWYFTHVFVWPRQDVGERVAQRGVFHLNCANAPACAMLRQGAPQRFATQAVAATRPWLMLGAHATVSWQFNGATPAMTTNYGDYSLAMYEDHGLHLVVLGIAQFVEALGLVPQWQTLGWAYRRRYGGFELY